MATLTDKEIIINIKEGRINYFEYIVKKYTRKVFVFVSRKLFDKSEAEDMVQNTFLKFYKSLSRYDVERPLLPYLFEIAKNEVRMYIRSRKYTISLDHIPEVVDTEEVELGQEFDIQRVLNKLSKDQKTVLLLTAEGYSYQEISLKLKKPINTIRTIVRRGRLKINTFKKHEKA